MPSTSKKQHNFMAAVANNPKFAKKAGVPKSVGEEFMKADKKKPMKMAGGGMPMVMKDGQSVPAFAADGKGKMAKGGMAHSDVKMDKKVVKKAVGMHEKQLHAGKKSNLSKLASGGLSSGHKAADGVASKGKTKGKMIKMRNGGSC
jgi:hypothetical protein